MLTIRENKMTELSEITRFFYNLFSYLRFHTLPVYPRWHDGCLIDLASHVTGSGVIS